jgi:hypothetical protein
MCDGESVCVSLPVGQLTRVGFNLDFVSDQVSLIHSDCGVNGGVECGKGIVVGCFIIFFKFIEVKFSYVETGRADDLDLGVSGGAHDAISDYVARGGVGGGPDGNSGYLGGNRGDKTSGNAAGE